MSIKPSAHQRQMLLIVFVLSGFAGLLYQSVWSHYLGLFLGHAAYAQALVLAMFMGGMAIGAAWIAKAGEKWRNLIRGYAVIELIIGLLGLTFHALFTGVMDLSYTVLIPAAESELSINAIKWLVAALLILPQTILLGMTFPLMSGGLIRRYPGQDGNLLGGLYFTNSMGAALGALASAFLLLPKVGLPGTAMSAGLLNILVALFAWLLAGSTEPRLHSEVRTPASTYRPPIKHNGLLRAVLVGTALSGAASFVYEIVWIRMLSMAVGSTLQAFELMLASFIAGIALGGLWIRKRADSTSDPLRLVGWMQILMGLAALLSLFFYAYAFEWVGWLMQALSRTDGGYTLFNLGTAGISILIMLPAAFFAGTTLPLFTVALLRSGYGERSIGRVYAWNTMGSIAGVFLAIHLLIPTLGLKLALCFGALIDMLIGLALLRSKSESRATLSRFVTASAIVAISLGLAVTQISFDPMRLASGVFRHGRTQLDPAEKILFYQDGKTASVSVIASPNGSVRIATNGKVDAAATIDPDAGPQYDEPTMALLGALPLAHHPDPQRIGIIGFGSGMSTHTVLGDARVGRVDTVEIEEAMVRGAQAFGHRVTRAYNDQRSNIIIDDAKAYFASQKGGYDIIISEPSNPWISGIGSLFSREFYEFIPRQIKDDGLFVQWIQLYEINDELVASILNAMTPSFGDYSAWLANQTDLIIIATPADKLPEVDYSRVLKGEIGDDLKYLGIEHKEQLEFRKVANSRMLRAFGRMHEDVSNSDFYPLLSLVAPKTRFTDQRASTIMMLPGLDYPALQLLGIGNILPPDIDIQEGDLYPGEWHTARARGIIDFIILGTGKNITIDDRANILQLLHSGKACGDSKNAGDDFLARLKSIATATVPFLPGDQVEHIFDQAEWTRCRQNHPHVNQALSLIEAMASRDVMAMSDAGTTWFTLRETSDAPGASSFDEVALISLLLAAASDQDWGAVREIEEKFGPRAASSQEAIYLRALLLSLADD